MQVLCGLQVVIFLFNCQTPAEKEKIRYIIISAGTKEKGFKSALKKVFSILQVPFSEFDLS